MIQQICQNALQAKEKLQTLNTAVKNEILLAISDALIAETNSIIAANQLDIAAGRKDGLSEALLDRLTLNEKRIQGMAESLLTIAEFKDPIGEVTEGFVLANGLKIEKVRAPLGVIAIIYESRPNVTIDAAALCLKSSNVSVLRGSSSALHSNKYLADLFNRVGMAHGLPEYSVQLVEDISHEALYELIQQDDAIDVLIPRGGNRLKKAMRENAKIPIIMTGAGTCHIFVDASADQAKAIPIILNAKTQRPGTCNSVECVLLHQDKISFAPELIKALAEQNVILHGSQKLETLLSDNDKTYFADFADTYFGEEFLAKEILLHVVNSDEEAIHFINQYGTHHSDAILTNNLNSAENFMNQVDSAVVYINASTRFSDGGEFGFGGEIGISTQKLHARGPMGISQLVSERYIVHGNGQIRE